MVHCAVIWQIWPELTIDSTWLGLHLFSYISGFMQYVSGSVCNSNFQRESHIRDETDEHVCLWYNVFTVIMKDDQEFLKTWLLSILMISMIFSESSIAFYFFLFEKIILLITFLTNPRLFLLFPFLSYPLTFTPKKSMCSYLKSTRCTYCCQYLLWQRAICRSRSSV